MFLCISLLTTTLDLAPQAVFTRLCKSMDIIEAIKSLLYKNEYWAQGFITSSRVVFESTSESMKYSINVKPPY